MPPLMMTKVMPTATSARKALPAAMVRMRLSGWVKLSPNETAPMTSVTDSMTAAPERCTMPIARSRGSSRARRSGFTSGASATSSCSATPPAGASWGAVTSASAHVAGRPRR
jgi:hypothetical protein